jgi:hypothetical protein
VPAVIFAIIVIIGVGRLFYVVGKRVTADAHAGAAAMENPRFDVFAFEQLPADVGRKLGPRRAELIALGFRELVSYTWRSTRANYSTVLVSPDGRSLATVWIASHEGLMLWLTVLNGWRAFRRELLAVPRYALITEFPELRRFETSPVELLASLTNAGHLEFLIVDESTTVAEALRKHEHAAREFAARTGLVALAVETAEHYFDLERGHMARMAARVRQSVS